MLSQRTAEQLLDLANIARHTDRYALADAAMNELRRRLVAPSTRPPMQVGEVNVRVVPQGTYCAVVTGVRYVEQVRLRYANGVESGWMTTEMALCGRERRPPISTDPRPVFRVERSAEPAFIPSGDES